MELPQPRPFGTEGKKLTREFLPLYGHLSFQHQDPTPTSGIHLKTHDFLQPLERTGKNEEAKGENKMENVMKAATVIGKLPPSSTALLDNVLPGGTGTNFSTSHIPNFSQRVPKPETGEYSTERNEEVSKANSDCSFYSNGGAFTLWREPLVKENGTTHKDNAGEKHIIKEPAEKFGPWSSERASRSLFIHRDSFSSRASSKPAGQKNQSFMEMMMKSSRVPHEEEEDDDEEFVVRSDGPSQKGDLTVKIDSKSTADQKPVTPRSKHSATEQRRRSKINDRFQILRELVPHSDQKRDKASFLLEVIEHIQRLQEKVHKYEQLYPGWNPEPTKLTPWRNSHGPGESMIDHSRAMNGPGESMIDPSRAMNGPGPGLMFAGKFDDNNAVISPTMLPNAQNVVESELSTGAAYRQMDHHPGLANKSVPLPIPMQPTMFTSVGQSCVLAQLPLRPMSDAENMSTQPQSRLWQNKPSCMTTGNTPNEQEDLTVEGGTINISSVYSERLLNSLTQALQSAGVDLSQASISVQIDLGKRAINRLANMTASAKDQEDPSGNQGIAHSTIASSGEDSDRAQKRGFHKDFEKLLCLEGFLSDVKLLSVITVYLHSSMEYIVEKIVYDSAPTEFYSLKAHNSHDFFSTRNLTAVSTADGSGYLATKASLPWNLELTHENGLKQRGTWDHALVGWGSQVVIHTTKDPEELATVASTEARRLLLGSVREAVLDH
ncbi:hypothetical protein NE237_021725 [Protea cynaroides]|uniref:BHLH domain-containing protein n=1 Tax=Protea cynaroides TaxID=273540 RepID=A0A9Q0H9L9_9MAGN|nr:hypothetical protein NE237_021725 [Protea cynaroides]